MSVHLRLLSAVALTTLLSSSTTTAAEFPDCSKGLLASNKVCDATLDPRTRATALVAEFTLAEKIQNTGNKSPGVSRLGLPAYEWWNEALHGVARSPGVKFASSGNFSYATSFPQPITLGAAFDMPLIRAVAETTSTEARAFSNAGLAGLNYWTPNINPFRDPRWGRGQEVPSEDAFFISQYVKQLIPGLQGPSPPPATNPFLKLVATCKHFAGYDMEDWQGHARYGFDARISAQDLRDYYLPPFEACARDARAGSFMCSYNAVNGVPTCADPWLLDSVLRRHWNWTGTEQWVTGDCGALQNVYVDHKYGSSAADAAAMAMNAGTDLDCGGFYAANMGAAVSGKLVEVKTLDESLVRRYASLVRLGYFDAAEKQPYRKLGWTDVATPEAKALALRASTEGMVLLKNTGVLPLSKSVRTVAVVGPMANATRQMQGNYYGTAQTIVSPSGGLQKAGFTVITPSGADVASVAKQADAVVFVGGIDNFIESEERDRNDISWPSAQLSLVKQYATAAAGKPFIVVQMGTMVDSSDLKTNDGVHGLLWAGYPGQDGGTAIANILSGVEAPAGRLPVTQYPANYTTVNMTDMALKPGNGNPGRTYKWYTGTPVYPFGHGLHYTNFTVRFSNPSSLPSNFTTTALASGSARWSDLLPFASLPVTVTNTGPVKSDYVVLALLKGEHGPKPSPAKSLVGFTRVHGIAPGSSATGTIDLTVGNIARSDEKGNLVLWPGVYSIVLDIDEKCAWDFTITGEPKTLDTMPARAS